jgi:hypothetical protein
MELEKQVCSLELAKRLKELGVEQSALFRHDTRLRKITWSGDIQAAPVDFGDRYIAAFTVAELGEMLPQVVQAKGRHDSRERLYYITPSAGGNGLRFIDYVAYENGAGTMLYAYPYLEGDTEADARAKMLIYLLEKGLVKTKGEADAQ